ncbi:uncharacterized protein [Dendrobates tinctorius]|uniref:uncharacterized protein n=1 Tax=Dendrobates tinctorius TaxID=92724 RepID=UPI003CCA1978
MGIKLQIVSGGPGGGRGLQVSALSGRGLSKLAAGCSSYAVSGSVRVVCARSPPYDLRKSAVLSVPHCAPGCAVYGRLLHEAHVTALSQITISKMARPLHDGSTSEPVGKIQSEASRTFPPDVSACEASSSSTICDQNLPASHPTAPTSRTLASVCQRRPSPSENHCQDRLEMVNSCDLEPSSTTYERRHCSCPESFSTGDTTAYGLGHTAHEHSRLGMGTDVSNQNDAQGDRPLAGDIPVEREIALRLRRIGDQMNERYLQRRQNGQRHWWGPLRWHLTQIISEIVAALYNPLVDILPQN